MIERPLYENRLRDIIYIAKNGKPVNGADQETIVQLLGDLAQDALDDIERRKDAVG